MGPAIAASKSVHLPYGFPEFGLSTPRGRPGWLRSVGNYILHSGALFAAYFDGNQQYPTLRLTDSASIRVWRGFVAQSRNGDPRPVPPASPTPTPSPSTSAPSASSAVSVTGLSLSPATVTAAAQDTATLTFKLSKRANVTVCVLNANGKVIRTVARPGAVGSVTISYLVHKRANHGLAPGRYTVLVVASNSGGSATGAATLTVG
jgi:hypothetical protein